MKKRRLLLGAIVSILMCLCVMGGATFALFTDKADVEVNITAGTVDIDAKVDGGLKLYSMDRYMGDGVLEFENLGYATLTDGNKITLVNITPGDKVEFDIAITSKSNVKTKVRTVVKETGVDTGLLAGLNVTVNDKDADLGKGEIVSEWVTVDPNANPTDNVLSVAIELPVEAGNEYQGKIAELRFTVEAVQWNGAPMPVVTSDALKSALENGLGEVKLENDIDLNDDPIVIDEDTVLDLNGYTLSGVSTSSSSSNLITVAKGSTLTIKNGTVSFAATTPDTEWGGEGQPPFPGYASNTINCRGNLIIDGATIENLTAAGGASYAIDCYDGGNLTINSGVVNGYDKTAIRMFASSATNSPVVTINGGTVTGYRAVWMQLPGSDNAVAPNALLTVNGGTLTSTDATFSDAIYTYSFGNSFAGSSIILNGGVYYGDVSFGGGEKIEAHKEIVLGNGCEFYGEILSYNPADNLQIEATKKVAIVDNATDFIASFATADVVILNADIDLASTTVSVNAGRYVILNLNGYELSGSCDSGSACLISVKNGGKLDILDGTEAGKVTYAEGSSNIGWTIWVEGELNLYSGTLELTGDWSIGYAVDIRPNAWGSAYTTGSVFNMYGGKIVSSDGAVRVASSSDSYANISASFIMYDGEINSEWDGIFIQQSNAEYDILSVELLGGKIDAKLSAVRFYGPDATSVIGGVAKPMTLVLGATELVEVFDSSRTYYVYGKIVYAGGMTLENFLAYTTIENR